jgi:8-oxo-dGTP diphosphatase
MPYELKKDQFYLTVDAVVFTILDKRLKILLVKRKYAPFEGKFALPGGFVRINENIEAAAARELEEETGVKGIYLKKMPSFGDVGRDPRGRVVTVPFLALIDGVEVKLHATGDAALARWHDAYALPEIGFDHKQIFEMALEELRDELESTSVAVEIMPPKFTLTEMQNAYEIIKNKKLDKRNFRKKMKEIGLLKELPETKMEGAHRPAQLYSFKSKGYKHI